MDQDPQPMFEAEQAAAGSFFLSKTCLFQKGTFWSTQAMFTPEQVVAGVFSAKRHAFFEKGQF